MPPRLTRSGDGPTPDPDAPPTPDAAAAAAARTEKTGGVAGSSPAPAPTATAPAEGLASIADARQAEGLPAADPPPTDDLEEEVDADLVEVSPERGTAVDEAIAAEERWRKQAEERSAEQPHDFPPEDLATGDAPLAQSATPAAPTTEKEA